MTQDEMRAQTAELILDLDAELTERGFDQGERKAIMIVVGMIAGVALDLKRIADAMERQPTAILESDGPLTADELATIHEYLNRGKKP